MNIINELVGGHQNKIRSLTIKEGKKNFRKYCNSINPEFFKDSRTFQEILCNTLQSMYDKSLVNPKTKKPYSVLVINLPPGHGKSYTGVLFATWTFGQSIKNQIITVSYNQTLSTRFAKSVREHIQDKEIVGEDDYYVVNSFFSGLKIKDGDGAMNLWSLGGSYMSYLATSFDGSITGMRGNIGIIDDPIKNKEEAVNEKVKEAHWDWYKNTFLSRMVEGAIQIIIQTRWATDDLAGRVIANFPEKTYVLEMPVLDEKKEPLCNEILSYEAIMDKKEGIDEDIFEANYMQKPIDKKGSLYKELKTYDVVDPDAVEDVISYIDTADEGIDFLCMVTGDVIGRLGYVKDIYYSDEPMEVTEEEVAKRLHIHGVKNAIFESNNGGRGFARKVEDILRTKYKNKKCNIKWFFQSKKKKTRIIVNSSNVMEQVVMPEGWNKRFNTYYFDMIKYQRKGKNEHDDAPDATTGFVEVINGEIKVKANSIADGYR